MAKSAADDRLRRASRLARDIVEANRFDGPPISPFKIANAESPRLKLIGGDFGSAFDGQIEYHNERDRFLIFFNTKYDAGVDPGQHHPRTRFSVSHELAHFYISSHREYIMSSGVPHQSRSEMFSTDVIVEREADYFSASLLMPDYLFQPLANKGELTVESIDHLSGVFQTSLVSTAIRAVELSHFPCALVGVRKGKIAWQFFSGALKEGGCYPAPRRDLESNDAQEYWRHFKQGETERSSGEARAEKWFRLFGSAAHKELWVSEYYVPVRVMDTLLVLLTVAEKDLFDLR